MGRDDVLPASADAVGMVMWRKMFSSRQPPPALTPHVEAEVTQVGEVEVVGLAKVAAYPDVVVWQVTTATSHPRMVMGRHHGRATFALVATQKSAQVREKSRGIGSQVSITLPPQWQAVFSTGVRHHYVVAMALAHQP